MLAVLAAEEPVVPVVVVLGVAELGAVVLVDAGDEVGSWFFAPRR